ncbi:MAG: phosphate acyltransferase PlsX [Gammaproteobacteria bacterium]|nr:phosphate acyltransferase PlsX [Gammaproteobacteria bacterium]
MSDKPIIAIDAMGGDFGPDVVIPAAVTVLENNKNLDIILVGDQELLQGYLSKLNSSIVQRLSIHHASEKVEMHDAPAMALRKKKDSSMRVAINLVHDKKADAIVSAGNTGALMATAKFVLKTLKGIDRPAIVSTLPSVNGHTYMLDLGANVDCTAQHLMQFAVMGSVLAEAMDNKPAPKVGLLNVGSEALKGNAQVKEADQVLSTVEEINYIGYVEGDDIYHSPVDVVVCDGFVGNVSLKTAEGVAKMVSQFMKDEFKRNWYNKIAALIALPVLKALKSRIDPRVYNGASLLGLRGIVIKSHGGADIFAFSKAIETAVHQVEEDLTQRIDRQLEHILDR